MLIIGAAPYKNIDALKVREKVLSRATIRKHIYQYKRDPAFTKSVLMSNIVAFVELYCFINDENKFLYNIYFICVGTKMTFH